MYFPTVPATISRRRVWRSHHTPTILMLASGLVCMLMLPGCYGVRSVLRNAPGLNDARFFAYRKAQPAAEPIAYTRVPEAHLGQRFTVRFEEFLYTLDEAFDRSPAVALLVIRNDSILYEQYRDGFGPDRMYTSFSIAKNFVNSLVGVAIQHGWIQSIEQPVTDFLPELRDRPGYDRIRLRHLMQMTSGIRFRDEKLNLLSNHARLYYGRHLDRATLKLNIAEPPGQTFDYNSGNTQLLGMILRRVSGQTLTALLEQYIWQPMGAAGPAHWSLDEPDGVEKAFCCIQARPLDFARYARMYSHSGLARGDTVLSPDWVQYTYTPDTTEGSSWDYHFHWNTWSHRYRLKVTLGLYNQFLLVYPEENIQIVAFMQPNLKKNHYWRHFVIQVIDQLALYKGHILPSPRKEALPPVSGTKH